MEESNIISPLWDHIEDLRKVILRCFAIILIGTVVAFLFHKPLIQWIIAPLNSALISSKQLFIEEVKQLKVSNPSSIPLTYRLSNAESLLSKNEKVDALSSHVYLLRQGGELNLKKHRNDYLIFLSPLDGFLSTLKICFWVGLIGTSPLWMYVLFSFIIPGLKKSEMQILIPLLILTGFFMGIGIIFALYVTIPLSNLFFKSFNQEIGLDVWSFTSYIDYSLGIIFGNSLASQGILILLVCIHLGIFNADDLIKKRRYSILAIFIFSALLTPPDIFSQLLLAIPLSILYELGILYAKWREKMNCPKTKLLSNSN